MDHLIRCLLPVKKDGRFGVPKVPIFTCNFLAFNILSDFKYWLLDSLFVYLCLLRVILQLVQYYSSECELLYAMACSSAHENLFEVQVSE